MNDLMFCPVCKNPVLDWKINDTTISVNCLKHGVVMMDKDRYYEFKSERVNRIKDAYTLFSTEGNAEFKKILLSKDIISEELWEEVNKKVSELNKKVVD